MPQPKRTAAREKPVRIDHWRVVWHENEMCLMGTMHGHPEITEGAEGFSSSIVRVEGKDVFTATGRCYRLGTPAPWSKAR